MFQKRKGQITLFIIIGLILLFLIGFIIYFVQIREVTLLTQKIRELANVPSTFEPIKTYIASCLEQVAEEGLKILGMQGGFIDASKFSFNPVEPTEGDAVQLSPDSRLIVPYWFYLKDKNTCEGKCTFSGNFPFLHREQGRPSIEGQIDDYVDKNIKICLGDFKSLKEKGFIVKELDKFKAKTSVAEESVFVEANYPLKIEFGNTTYEFKEHIVELNLNLNEIYNLALNITILQKEYRYLEGATKQLISAFSRSNPRALPPFSDLDFDFGGGVHWSLFDVEKRLKILLSSYVKFLQVFYTKNYEYIKSPFRFPEVVDEELFENLYNRHFMIFLNESHPDLDVRFNYLDWHNPYLDLNCRGQICGPESFALKFLFIFGIQRYSFAYDVSFPVLVDISNSDSLKGKGYSFKFFLESNLRNNDPMPAIFKPLKMLSFETGSLLINPEQFTSPNITFEVCEGKTKKPIDSVHVTFTCGTESVVVGELRDGKMKTKLPRCLNGYVSLVKQDYFSTNIPIDTFLEEEQNISTCVYPYHYVNFSVKKYLVKKSPSGWFLDTENPVLHERNESSVIVLTRNGSEWEESFNSFVEVYGDKLSAIDAELGKNIRLVPGNYDVKIQTFLYADPPLLIPSGVRCKKFFKGYKTDCECFVVPDSPIIFNETSPLPAGRAAYNWQIKPEELYEAKEIEFPIVYLDLKSVPDDCSPQGCLSIAEQLLDAQKIGKAILAALAVYYTVGAAPGVVAELAELGIVVEGVAAAAFIAAYAYQAQKEIREVREQKKEVEEIEIPEAEANATYLAYTERLLRQAGVEQKKEAEKIKDFAMEYMKQQVQQAARKKIKINCGREIEDLEQLGALESYILQAPELFKPMVKK